MSDILLKEEILKYLSFDLDPTQLFVFKTLNSTNLYAKELAKSNHPHFTAIIANRQTNGRGRLGREFFSPEDTGIYMSIILDCDKIILPQNLLTIATGTAICRVFKHLFNIDSSIKWVNDIFFNNKKVCGILAESVADPCTNLPKYIIMGIGINVSTPEQMFPGKLSKIAGSIFPQNISRNEIIARIISELRNIYAENDIQKLIAEYKSYSMVLGKKISFTKNCKAFSGIACDINCEGNLMVRLDNNELLVLKSGEVSLGSEFFAKKSEKS